MIKNILVALDGSESSESALRFALDIAAKYQARVSLIHVLLRHADPGDLLRLNSSIGLSPADRSKLEEIQTGVHRRIAPSSAYVPPIVVPDEILEQVGREILKHAEQVAKEFGIEEVATFIENGNPANRILACAEQEDADLIVMGHRGLSHLGELLMGGISHKVCQLAKCACLTIKHSSPNPAD